MTNTFPRQRGPRHVARAVCHSHESALVTYTTENGWGYSTNKTVCESDIWFQRYKLLKIATGPDRIRLGRSYSYSFH